MEFQQSTGLSVDCFEDLEKFLQEPPACIRIQQEAVVKESGRLCVPFSCPVLDSILAEMQLTCFVCDFTYKVCKEGLLLGCVGPCGLRETEGGPAMRMIPAFFVAATAEDEESTKVLLRLYFQFMKSKGLVPTDGFFDCSCMQAAVAFCQEENVQFYVHRCLQHVKWNVRDEAGRRDAATGRARLKNRELLSVLTQWIEFSAFLPSDMEFSTFWSSVLGRMLANVEETDLNEPQMAQYLKKNILDSNGHLAAITSSSFSFKSVQQNQV